MTITTADITKTGYFNNGTIHTGSRMMIGQNSSWSAPWGSTLWFIDLMRMNSSGNGYAGAVGPDANGYFDCSAGGSYAQYYFWTNNNWLPSDYGNIVIEWVGTCDCTLSAGTLQSSGSNRKVYSVPSPTNVAVNTSGGTCTSINVFYADNETAFDAGDTVDPVLVTDLSNLHVMRFMDAQNTVLSAVVDYTDYQPAYGYPREQGIMSMRAIAEVCNAVDCDPWICVPVMATDACVTSMASDLNTYLDNTRTVYLEYGNEHWNSASTFNIANKYVAYEHIAHVDAAVTPATASVASTAHGLTTGDEILTFPTMDVGSIYPYNIGLSSFVIVDDVNTFRLATSYANAIADTDDAPLNAGLTEIRYKDIEGQSPNLYVNYATRSKEVWDIFDTEFTRARVKTILGSQQADTSVTTGVLGVTATTERYDYLAVAPYFYQSGQDPSVKTPTEITDWFIDNEFDGIATQIAAHQAITGKYNVICYEGGDHTDVSDGDDFTAMKAWNDSSESGRAYTAYMTMLADARVPLFVNYKYVSWPATYLWGSMYHTGDTDHPKYISMKAAQDAGGVSKS